MKRITAVVDGACWKNPGPAAVGIVLHKGDRAGPVLEAIGQYIGHGTNNVAEYKAVRRAAERGRALGATQIDILTDSKLVRKQVRGDWRVNKPHLRRLHSQVLAELAPYEHWRLIRASRSVTAPADRAATLAIQERGNVELPIDKAGRIVPPAADSWQEFAARLEGELDADVLDILRQPLDTMRERDGYRYMGALRKLRRLSGGRAL